MSQTLFPWSYGRWSSESPFWTLTIEAVFYLLVPWWASMFYRNRWRWSLPVCLGITLAWLYLCRSGAVSPLVDVIVNNSHRPGAGPEFARYYLSKQFPAHIFDFACGMTVANWYCQYRSGRRPLPVRILDRDCGAVLTMSAFAAVGSSMWLLGHLSNVHTYYDGIRLIGSHDASSYIFYFLEEPSMAAPWALIVAGCLISGRWIASIFASSLLRIVGVLGYSIYLWHMPNLYRFAQLPWMMHISPGPRLFVLAVTVGSIVAALSLFTYLTVERPFIDRGRRSHVRTSSEEQQLDRALVTSAP
jgi:peptidoglycan/LPS O-acetylase OafA/YrhL